MLIHWHLEKTLVYLILNSNVDKLKTVATDSNNSTPKVDKLDTNELKTVPADLKNFSDVA